MAALWQEENRIPTLQEARTYLDMHAESDDPAAWTLCENVAEAASGHRVAGTEGDTVESPFVKPPEEQLEEGGAD